MATQKRSRPDSIAPAIAPQPDITSLTNTLRSHLRAYTALIPAINSNIKDVNQVHTELDQENKPISLVKSRFDRLYDQLGDLASDELNKIELMLETLDKVEKATAYAAMLEGGAPSPAASGVGNGAKRGSYNKRRKTEGASAAPSPVASNAGSPLPMTASSVTGSPAPTSVPLPRMGKNPSQQQAPPGPIIPTLPSSSRVSPAPSSSSSVAGSNHAGHGIGPTSSSSNVSGTNGVGERGRKSSTTSNRKAAMASQLPLAPGRQIAFRLPSKGGPADQRPPEQWILAKVVSCIQGDKNRYTVIDVDYDPKASNAEGGGKYNTTLKSIVPLPDERDRANTYPFEEYPAGTAVMALYPQTTSFYRAFVHAAPSEIDKGKKKGPAKVYRVTFDDDENDIKEVAMELGQRLSLTPLAFVDEAHDGLLFAMSKTVVEIP